MDVKPYFFNFGFYNDIVYLRIFYVDIELFMNTI
jgi:hypothetical protein